ncbi:hypothetical protein B0H21DRAFT_844915 [Amylocystis lapponica]|nr:hypothetical protein B0H21DRAFT_844915 [Amylocystis lapponica]
MKYVVVREINKINERELDLGISGSWHDDYKDSAYIFIGGIHSELTEGDVIAIFSQYGEVMDVNLPRDKDTGKTRGFGFLMYEDQRSTVLAVDNLNGANVMERTLRVDHVKNYKQPKVKGEDGERYEPEEQSFNAKPQLIIDGDAASESSEDDGPPIDLEDPMYDYLVAKRKEERAARKAKKGKSKPKGKKAHKDETPEERRARKERKKLRKGAGKSEGTKAVEDLLNSLTGRVGDRERDPHKHRTPSPEYAKRSGSRTPWRERDADDRRTRYHSPERRRSRSPNRSPMRDEHSVPTASHSPGPGTYDTRASRYEDVKERRGYGHDRLPPSRRRGEYD